MAQRVGPVKLEDDDHDNDRTLVDVPQHAIGFVTGKNGNFLRTIEEEWCVIMFFVEFEKEGSYASLPVDELSPSILLKGHGIKERFRGLS